MKEKDFNAGDYDGKLLKLAREMVDTEIFKTVRQTRRLRPARAARQPVRFLLSPRRRKGHTAHDGKNVRVTVPLMLALREHALRVADASSVTQQAALIERAVSAAGRHPHDRAYRIVRGTLMERLSGRHPVLMMTRYRRKHVHVSLADIVVGEQVRRVRARAWGNGGTRLNMHAETRHHVTLDVRVVQGDMPLPSWWEALGAARVSDVADVPLNGAFSVRAGGVTITVPTVARRARVRAYLVEQQLIVVAAVGMVPGAG